MAANRIGWLRAIGERMSRSRRLARYLGRPYLQVNTWIWNHLPASLTKLHLGWAYGAHLHKLIQSRSDRRQGLGTFFFRNRPELELLIRLLDRKRRESTLDLSILGCSKGAEVYSISYSIRRARPDLKLKLTAVDINPDVLGFAKEGVYSLKGRAQQNSSSDSAVFGDDLASRTFADQNRSVFERMSPDEIEAMFECEGDQASVRPQFREGITWQLGDAGDQELVDIFGLQDIVIANRFLCHMRPAEAETCLRNLAHLVKPGGYLFVSGVDLAVRSRVARELSWTPITELMDRIHEGDPSLRRDWPLQYWGLEPFDRQRKDCTIRYASVFQIGLPSVASTTTKSCARMGGEIVVLDLSEVE